MRLLTALRIACFIEAISALILFGVAVPLKHFAGHPEAVRIVGPIHGCLFLLAVGLLYAAYSGEQLRPRLARWVLVGTIVPGVAFFVDHQIKAAQVAANEAGE